MKFSTKEKILDAAQSLIGTKGYHGTGTNAIIEKASVSKGSFFYHFPDKSKLLRATVVKYYKEGLSEPLEQVIEKYPDEPEKGLIQFLNDIFRWYQEMNFQSGCLLGNIALELSDTDNAIRQDVHKMFRQWHVLLSQYLADHPLGMNRDDFITLYIASIEGVTMLVKTHKDLALAEAQFKACRNLVHMAFGSEQQA